MESYIHCSRFQAKANYVVLYRMTWNNMYDDIESDTFIEGKFILEFSSKNKYVIIQG